MSSPTLFDLTPTATLAAVITSPPSAQFTPGPGCIDPEDNWIVATSCYAEPVDEAHRGDPSPDWLTCQVTEFGPPPIGATGECFAPPSTVGEGITTWYTGCASGYTALATNVFTYTHGDRYEVSYLEQCCPSEHEFGFTNEDYGYEYGERDGVAWSGLYPLPPCSARYVKEFSGINIPVQTAYNTGGWEKRQLAEVPWDYESGTLFAEMQYASSTVFDNTHTCYGNDCLAWRYYYYLGEPMPTEQTEVVTVLLPTETTTIPPVDEPITTDPPVIETETETETLPPVEETSSSSEGIDEPTTTTSPADEEDSPPITSSDADDDESQPPPTMTSEFTTTQTLTHTPTSDESDGNPTPSSTPATTTSDTPKSAGVRAVISRTGVVVFGVLASLFVL
ncbi:hypothetical protein GGS20DRAFT_356133 [Poronia punctata]|nr:hypothetical protein GGS20DRAFT_356133 [Poronia punctata]